MIVCFVIGFGCVTFFERQNQQTEFAQFKGPIIMTSNCIIQPRRSYMSRIYTTNAAGWPGVTHVSKKDFSSVIKQALEMEGFTEEPSQAAKVDEKQQHHHHHRV